MIQTDEDDFKTAFSYFYEAFEAYHTNKHKLAGKTFKYMLISKIMNNEPEDIYGYLNGKYGVNYKGWQYDAVRALGDAAKV